MQERKIPTIIGLLLVCAVIIIFKFGFERISPLLTKASATITPTNVTVSNISDTTYTVTWITKEPTTGSIRLDGALPNSFFFDERISGAGSNTQLTTETYTTHVVTVRNLKPDTLYKFSIVSNGFSYTNNGKPYEIQTAPTIPGVGTGIEPAYGQLSAPSGSPFEGAIVYLTLENGQTLSSMTKSSGTWVIPLNLVRSTDLSHYIEQKERINESIIIRGNGDESSALTDTLNDNPVPAMTLGKTYDFRKIQAENKQSQPLTLAPSPAVLGTNTQTAPQNVSIVRPAQGAAIPSNLPVIQGTGIAGNQVLITVGMTQPVSDTVIIGSDGIWRYTPIRPLMEGKQSVTITSANAQNKAVAITHTFEILKSGTQVLGDATPSATLTPLPTIADEPIVTDELTPTSTLAGDPIPETGYPLPLVILLILGIGLLSGGALILRF